MMAPHVVVTTLTDNTATTHTVLVTINTLFVCLGAMSFMTIIFEDLGMREASRKGKCKYAQV